MLLFIGNQMDRSIQQVKFRSYHAFQEAHERKCQYPLYGGRPRAINDPIPDMDSYTKVDINLILDNFYKNLEIRGTVFNLFDEDYAYPSAPDIIVPVTLGTLYHG